MPEPPEEHFSRHAEDVAQANAMEDMPDAYVALLDKFVERVGDGRVLDAGCGTGKDVAYFRKEGLDAVGVDVAEGMLAYAQEHTDGEYHRMDVRDLAFKDASFDGVWCNTVMQFFPPDEMAAVVAELVRVLKAGGILYTTFKVGEGRIVTEDFGEEIERHQVSEERARTMLTGHGLRIQDVRRADLHGLTVLNVFCTKQG